MEKVDTRIVKKYVDELYELLSWFMGSNDDFYRTIQNIKDSDLSDLENMNAFISSCDKECRVLSDNAHTHMQILDAYHQKIFGKSIYAEQDEDCTRYERFSKLEH